MGFEKGNKLGGRKKGSKNKLTFNAEMIAEELGVDPLELCLRIAGGDWKGAGFPDEFIFIEKADGAVAARPTITPEMRLGAIKEACKYFYATKQAVALTGPDGNELKIIIEDYKKNGT